MCLPGLYSEKNQTTYTQKCKAKLFKMIPGIHNRRRTATYRSLLYKIFSGVPQSAHKHTVVFTAKFICYTKKLETRRKEAGPIGKMHRLSLFSPSCGVKHREILSSKYKTKKEKTKTKTRKTLKIKNITCVGSLPACMFMHHIHACTCGGHKRPSDPLELGLQMVVSCHISAGNWTHIPWKSSQCLTTE